MCRGLGYAQNGVLKLGHVTVVEQRLSVVAMILPSESKWGQGMRHWESVLERETILSPKVWTCVPGQRSSMKYNGLF